MKKRSLDEVRGTKFGWTEFTRHAPSDAPFGPSQQNVMFNIESMNFSELH